MFQELKDLEVYRISDELSDRFWTEVSKWGSFAKDTVGKQLIRAVDSIGANIAESYGRYHYRERLNFLYYARGSAYEAKFWMERARRRNLISPQEYGELMEVSDQLLLKLNAYIKSKRRQATGAANQVTQLPGKLSTEGGNIQVQSEAGKGNTFTAFLPTKETQS